MSSSQFNNNNWKLPENIAPSFQQVDQLFDCLTLHSAPANRVEFEHAPQDILGISVDLGDGNPQSVADILQVTHTDALLVIKDDKIAAEHYFNGMTVDQRHLLNSITKSFVGLLAGIAVERGQIDLQKLVTDYVPGLKDSAWSGATVRQVLDMTASVQYSEDYDDPTAGFNEESALVGWRSPLLSDRPCDTLFDFAQSLQPGDANHGDLYCYRTVCTNVLGMILEEAMDQPLERLLQHELWGKLGGRNHAAIVKDASEFPYVGAGLNTCTRDLARFGLMILNHGALNGEQIIPASWVDDTFAGSDECRAQFAASKYAEIMPGWYYRNQCWVPALGRDVILGLGIHGQALFVDRTTNTVMVKFSSQPKAEMVEMHLAGLAAMNAIALSLN
ncbi:MAG: serine hydrolase [Candidatus Pelagadaptatus aseana]|uniref:serine hydrolase domain-containing protein n=1 Tax=Candidatus Pelagadaptatus aseana TaxID=3120508 RepID=UPI0039B2FD1A